YGSILKDGGTDKIVGHLVELGRITRVLDAIPLGPLSALAKAAGAVATQYRLGRIENIARLADGSSTAMRKQSLPSFTENRCCASPIWPCRKPAPWVSEKM